MPFSLQDQRFQHPSFGARLVLLTSALILSRGEVWTEQKSWPGFLCTTWTATHLYNTGTWMYASTCELEFLLCTADGILQVSLAATFATKPLHPRVHGGPLFQYLDRDGCIHRHKKSSLPLFITPSINRVGSRFPVSSLNHEGFERFSKEIQIYYFRWPWGFLDCRWKRFPSMPSL